MQICTADKYSHLMSFERPSKFEPKAEDPNYMDSFSGMTIFVSSFFSISEEDERLRFRGAENPVIFR